MAAIEKFRATVSQEASGVVRGKIPAGLTKALRAEDGSVIEFEVQGRLIIGGKVLNSKEAARYKSERAAAPVPSKKTAAAVKTVKKKTAPVEEPAPKTKSKKKVIAQKASKRKTKVEYEEPAEVSRPKKKKKISFRKK